MLKLTALKEFMVLDKKTGVVDHAASHAKLTEQLSEYELRHGEEEGLAARAVKQVFDTYKGTRMSMKFIVGQCLTILAATPDNWNVLEEAVNRFIKSNVGERNVSMFGQAKAVGTWRWCDLPEEPIQA